jgi:hypothetical protein
MKIIVLDFIMTITIFRRAVLGEVKSVKARKDNIDLKETK